MVSFQASHIRPTTDRVKESMFNKVAFRLEEARVLDLFSGTGSLSIESLSRGAESVDAVESHSKSLEIIKKNKEKLKIGKELKLIKMDVFRFLEKSDLEPYDVVFVDPPFTKKIAHKVMLKIERSLILKNGTLVVIESAMDEPIESEYLGFHLLDVKDYGDKKVSYFEYKGL